MLGSTKQCNIAPQKAMTINHTALKTSKLRCNVPLTIHGSIHTHAYVSDTLYMKPSKVYAPEFDNLQTLYKKIPCLMLLNGTSSLYSILSQHPHHGQQNDQCTALLNYLLHFQMRTNYFYKICKHTILICQSF